MTFGRIPPHNYEAEQGLLGAIFMRNSLLDSVMDFLRPEHFAEPAHGHIYEAALKLLDRGRRIDPMVVKEMLAGDEQLAQLGGNQYLAAICAGASPPALAVDLGRIVHDAALRRRLIEIGEDLVDSAFEPGDHTASSIQEEAEAELFRLSSERPREENSAVGLGAILSRVADTADAIVKAGGTLRGLPTGFVDLDRKLGGLHPSDLIILAGRPSMGKTALATNIAFSAAKAGRKVLFFSLEMSSEQLGQRISCQDTGIKGQKFLGDGMTAADVESVVDCVRRHAETPLYIDDTPMITVPAIRTRARRQARRGGLDMIVIDYLQLIGSVASSGRRGPENRVQEISDITRGLKALAKELNVPVLALSQLSRAVEQREDKRPQLSDLRESGSIEQDADVVMFVYREQYYLERAEPKPGKKHEEWEDDLSACANVAEVIAAKHRRGSIGTVRLHFSPETITFGNLDNRGPQ